MNTNLTLCKNLPSLFPRRGDRRFGGEILTESNFDGVVSYASVVRQIKHIYATTTKTPLRPT